MSLSASRTSGARAYRTSLATITHDAQSSRDLGGAPIWSGNFSPNSTPPSRWNTPDRSGARAPEIAPNRGENAGGQRFVRGHFRAPRPPEAGAPNEGHRTECEAQAPIAPREAEIARRRTT